MSYKGNLIIGMKVCAYCGCYKITGTIYYISPDKRQAQIMIKTFLEKDRTYDHSMEGQKWNIYKKDNGYWGGDGTNGELTIISTPKINWKKRLSL